MVNTNVNTDRLIFSLCLGDFFRNKDSNVPMIIFGIKENFTLIGKFQYWFKARFKGLVPFAKRNLDLDFTSKPRENQIL